MLGDIELDQKPYELKQRTFNKISTKKEKHIRIHNNLSKSIMKTNDEKSNINNELLKGTWIFLLKIMWVIICVLLDYYILVGLLGYGTDSVLDKCFLVFIIGVGSLTSVEGVCSVIQKTDGIILKGIISTLYGLMLNFICSFVALLVSMVIFIILKFFEWLTV